MATFGKRKAVGLDDQYARVKKPTDKRASDRTPTYQNAVIIFPDGSQAECIIRDVCEGGCLVTAIGTEGFPDTLIIKIGPAARIHNARVAWRDKGMCGLEFLNS